MEFFKGLLIVDKDSWCIEYTFRPRRINGGPDLRYDPTIIKLPGGIIDQYIAAFCDNFKEYERIKAITPDGGEFEKKGKMFMIIKVGGYTRGVCLHNHYMPIGTQEHLDMVLESYKYAKEKAALLQEEFFPVVQNT